MPIDTDIVVAVIALGGIIVSVAVSLAISQRQTRSELQKLRTEIQQSYAEKLLEKRIAVYPELYHLLSDFTKGVRESGAVSRGAVKELRDKIADWNSENAVFFSGNTNELDYRFRRRLTELLRKTEGDFRQEFETSNARLELSHAADAVKLGLKTDLGIFSVELPEGTKKFKSFEELAKTMQDEEKAALSPTPPVPTAGTAASA